MKRTTPEAQLEPSLLHNLLPITWLGLLFLLGMLVGCSPLQQLQTANNQPTSASGFRAAIAQEYAAYAESEGELGRNASRDHFARKGLAALQGKEINPDTLDTTKLTETQLADLRPARERLLGMRTEFLERVVSTKVARAQLFFDCWAMQSVTPNADSESLPCRESFMGEMQAIEQVVDALGQEPDVTLPVEYTILFDTGSSELSRDGEYAIEQALAISTLHPTAQLTLTGHTDRDGSKARNLVLSQARADTVSTALIAVGIAPERITVSAVGEDNLATPTLDGINRERNRRVTIKILATDDEDLKAHDLKGQHDAPTHP